MSLENIVHKIMEDAQAGANQILSQSKDKADRIKQEARKTAEKQVELLLRKEEREAQLEGHRMVTQARLEKKLYILSIKKQLINDVMEKAFQKKNLAKAGLERRIILKEGEKKELLDENKLKEELRPDLENYIVEILKI